jgi:hypothetical protein
MTSQVEVLHVIVRELLVNNQYDVGRLAIKVDGWEAIYIPELCYDDATPGTLLVWELVSNHWVVDIALGSTLNAEQGRVSDISQHSHNDQRCDVISSTNDDDI